MLLNFIFISFKSLFIATVIYVLATLFRNYRASKFFKNHGSQIPVLPNWNVFFGNAMDTYLHRRNWKVMSDLHSKYGLTYGWFYFDKPVISTIDLDFIKAVNIDENHDHFDRLVLNIPVSELIDDSIAFAEHDQWLRLRKAMAPAFSAHKVKQPNVLEELTDIVNRFIQSIEARLNRAKERGKDYVVEDAEDIMHRYALAVMFKSFYKQNNVIDLDGEVDEWVRMIGVTLKNFDEPFLRMSIMFPILRPLISWLLIKFAYQGVMRNQIMEFIKRQTKNNMMARQQLASMKANKKGDTFDKDNFVLKDGSRFRRNMIDYITDQYHDGMITQKEYYNSSFFLFFAANKTSSDTIAKLIYNMARYKSVQDKVRESVAQYGIDSEYLAWTINESMRLFPPAPLGSVRTVTRDFETKAGLVPAGTCMFTALNAIHKLPEYWGPDADVFRPERWVDSKGFHPCQFMPFGVGRRNCFGKEFALQSIKMVTVALIQKFKFEAVSDEADIYEYTSPGLIFCVAEMPLKIKITLLDPPST